MRQQPATYGGLLRTTLALGRLAARATRPGETVGVLMPNLSISVALIMGLTANSRIAAILNYSSGLESMRVACRAARLQTVITSRAFLHAAKLQDAVNALPDMRIVYLEDLSTSLTALDYTLTVRDTFTGRVRTYDSQKFGFPPAMACGVADTRAFDGACSARTHLTPLAESEFSAVSASTLFLLGGRFRATLRATDPRTSRTVEGEAIARADGFGYFSLPGFTGDSSFPEVFVKMTDGTAAPGNSYWVFHSGLTDVDYTLTVTDQVTGAVKSYRPGAPTGGVLCGQADTSAFRN